MNDNLSAAEQRAEYKNRVKTRTIYPRLCWGCLDIIEERKNDCATLDCGGIRSFCFAEGVSEMPFLKQVLKGNLGRMNHVTERDTLLRKVAIPCVRQFKKERDKTQARWRIRDDAVLDALRENGYNPVHPADPREDKDVYILDCPMPWNGRYPLPDGRILTSCGSHVAL